MKDLTIPYEEWSFKMDELKVLKKDFFTILYRAYNFENYPIICNYLKDIFQNSRIALTEILKYSDLFTKLEENEISKECVYTFSMDWRIFAFNFLKSISTEKFLEYVNFLMTSEEFLNIDTSDYSSIESFNSFKQFAFQMTKLLQGSNVIVRTRKIHLSSMLRFVSESLSVNYEFDNLLRANVLAIYCIRFVELTLLKMGDVDFKSTLQDTITLLKPLVTERYLVLSEIYTMLKDEYPCFYILNNTGSNYREFKEKVDNYIAKCYEEDRNEQLNDITYQYSKIKHVSKEFGYKIVESTRYFLRNNSTDYIDYETGSIIDKPYVKEVVYKRFAISTIDSSIILKYKNGEGTFEKVLNNTVNQDGEDSSGTQEIRYFGVSSQTYSGLSSEEKNSIVVTETMEYPDDLNERFEITDETLEQGSENLVTTIFLI